MAKKEPTPTVLDILSNAVTHRRYTWLKDHVPGEAPDVYWPFKLDVTPDGYSILVHCWAVPADQFDGHTEARLKTDPGAAVGSVRWGFTKLGIVVVTYYEFAAHARRVADLDQHISIPPPPLGPVRPKPENIRDIDGVLPARGDPARAREAVPPRAKKPPRGVRPQSIHEGIRVTELTSAITRAIDAGTVPRKDWVEELSALYHSLVRRTATIKKPTRHTGTV